jgi:flagellar protein FlbT
MALVIGLKPGEKILIGSAVITNDKQRTRLHISGDAAILREKDVMQEEEANTPCKKIYFLIQCMYLANTPKDYHQAYFSLVKEIQHAAPSTSPLFLEINESIIDSHYYKAMKSARNLITFEEELLGHATGKTATAE